MAQAGLVAHLSTDPLHQPEATFESPLVANEWRPWFAAAAPRYPFMINYVVAANVKRFVRLAFVYTFAEIHRCPYMVPLLPINQARDVQSPTG